MTFEIFIEELKNVFQERDTLKKIVILQKDILILLTENKISMNEANIVIQSIDKVKDKSEGLQRLQAGVNEYKKTITPINRQL